MIADGLDCAGILRSADREMGLYLIELDGVERSFHYWRKGSAASRLADDLPALEAALGKAGLVHVSGITLAILGDDGREDLFACLAKARQAGSVISFDPNVRPRLWTSQEACRESIATMLSLTDVALPSFDDEATLWGDAVPSDTIARMAARGVAEIVVKDGAGPVHAWHDGDELKIATPAVENLRDTTGAGDAFNAGYLAARFLRAHVAEAVAMGQRLSGKVIGCLGARADRQSLEAVRNDLLFAD